jgi:Domain of unknown function (DUF4157)
LALQYSQKLKTKSLGNILDNNTLHKHITKYDNNYNQFNQWHNNIDFNLSNIDIFDRNTIQKVPNRTYGEYSRSNNLAASYNNLYTNNNTKIQAKLKTSQPGDEYEREADNIADLIVNTGRSNSNSRYNKISDKTKEFSSTIQKIQNKKEDVNDDKAENRELEISTRPLRDNDNGHTELSGNSLILINSILFESGQPLDSSTKEFMEAKSGFDFSNIRIHNNDNTHESAQKINAEAYTIGNHIMFAKDQYLPQSSKGIELLAHELAHTIQSKITRKRTFHSEYEELEPNYDNKSVSFKPVLQHKSINTTVHGQMLFRQQKTSTTSSTKIMSLIEFAEIMNKRFGVVDVIRGSKEGQILDLTPYKGDIRDWKPWYPGQTSMIYSWIIKAFEDFSVTFGGFPNVKKIIFYNKDYKLDENGILIPQPEAGANFGGGIMAIFHAFEGGTKPLPVSRSNIEGKYPPMVADVTDKTKSPGAPLRVPTPEQSAKRIISHELGHGLIEAVLGPNPAEALDKNMIKDYKKTIGWTANPENLFDTGVKSVRDDLENERTPSEAFHITLNHWNEAKWKEQPLTSYSLYGPTEDFADSVMGFIYAPDLLKSRSSSRFKFLNDRKNSWLSRLLKLAPLQQAK